MHAAHTEATFERIRCAVGQRIRQDAMGDDSLYEVFSHIADHFAEDDFAVDRMTRDGILTRRLQADFRASTRRTIHQYVKWRQFDLAKELLAHADLEIGVIAERLHYAHPQNFSRHFSRRSGQSPEAFRAANRTENALGGPRSDAHREVAQRIQERAGIARPGTLLVSNAGALREAVDWVVWSVLRDETPTMQQMILRNGLIRFATDAFFEIVSKQSRREGFRDRPRGVALAKVALASVEGSAELLGDRAPELTALALARLGDAERLAGNQPAAVNAFELAREALKASKTTPRPRISAEIGLLEATLLAERRRFDQALTTLAEVITNAREADAGELLVAAFLESAYVLESQGAYEQAVSRLRETEQILQAQANPDWTRYLLVYQELSLAYLELGEQHLARETLELARAVCDRVENPDEDFQVTWIEGRLTHLTGADYEAEKLLRHARCGFAQSGERARAALTALDLARVCQEQKRYAEALMLIKDDVVPVLEGLQLGREHTTAMKLLEDAISAGSITADTINRAREQLRTIRLAPR